MDKCDGSGCKPQVDEKLLLEGWQQRFVGDERMVKEACQTYESLGYEVQVLSLEIQDLQEGCEGCMGMLKSFKVLYTRKKGEESQAFSI